MCRHRPPVAGPAETHWNGWTVLLGTLPRELVACDIPRPVNLLVPHEEVELTTNQQGFRSWYLRCALGDWEAARGSPGEEAQLKPSEQHSSGHGRPRGAWGRAEAPGFKRSSSRASRLLDAALSEPTRSPDKQALARTSGGVLRARLWGHHRRRTRPC